MLQRKALQKKASHPLTLQHREHHARGGVPDHDGTVGAAARNELGVGRPHAGQHARHVVLKDQAGLAAWGKQQKGRGRECEQARREREVQGMQDGRGQVQQARASNADEGMFAFMV